MTSDNPENETPIPPDHIEPEANEAPSGLDSVNDTNSAAALSIEADSLTGSVTSPETLPSIPIDVHAQMIIADVAEVGTSSAASVSVINNVAGSGDGDAAEDKDDTTSADDETPNDDPFMNEKEENERSKKLEEESDAREKAQREYRLLDFNTVARAYLKHIDSVFEDPPNYKGFLDRVKHDPLRDNNIFIVAGKRNSGRYAIALDLALTINNKRNPPQIYEYVPDANTSTFSLQEILSKLTKREDDDKDKGLPKHSVLIIRDLFEESRNRERELSRTYVQRFRKILADSEVRVILTTTRKLDKHLEFKENFLCFDTMTKNDEIALDLGKVFDNHRDVYFEEGVALHDRIRTMLTDIKKALLVKLTRPVDIYNFFERIGTDEPQDADEALKWAEDLVGQYDRRTQTRDWFEKLESNGKGKLNEKLYVMLVVLFKGLPHAQLNELYDSMVKILRADLREIFDDPRATNVEQMLDNLRLQDRSDVLAFIGQYPQEYEKEIGYQIKNYYRLLWTLVEPLIETLKTAKEQRVRRLLATAIAQIGIYRKTGLDEELTRLANHPDARVVLSTADILRYLAQDVAHHKFILDVLKEWVGSKNYDQMWAAIVAISSVYESILNRFPLPKADEIRKSENQPAASSANAVLDDAETAWHTLQELQGLLNALGEAVHEADMSAREESLRERAAFLFEEVLKRDPDLREAYENDSRIHRELDQKHNEWITIQLQIQRRAIADDLIIALTRSLESIAQSSTAGAEAIIELLIGWMTEDENSLRWQIGRMTANRIYLSTQGSQLTVVQDWLPYLDLLPKMLETSENVDSNMIERLYTAVLGDDMVAANLGQSRAQILLLTERRPSHTAMDVLNSWYGYLLDNQEAGADVSLEQNLWRSAIYPKLLVTINGASQLCRELLKDALIRYWLDSEHSEVRRSAMALLTRAYILDGFVLDVPISRFGVLMIDAGQIDEEDYLEAAFNISQRLTMLAPLHVYHLGSQTPPILLGEFRPDDQDTGTANSKALILPGQPRPRLMMPLLESLDNSVPRIDPENCHFVLILNTREVLDWGEMMSEAQELLALKQPTSAVNNPFQRKKDLERTSETQNWRWMGKFILSDKELPPPPESLPDGAFFTYSAEKHFKPDILDAIEDKLQQQIILALQRLSLDRWVEDLSRYAKFPEGFPATFEAAMARCRKWLEEINVVFETIPPRDVTLNISWLVLLMAQRELEESGNLNQIVAFISSWLSSDDANEKLVGRACTKQLFNFYGVEGGQPIVAKHGALLSLLRPFMHQKPDYAEFGVIFRLLLRWAEQSAWSECLIAPADGTISETLAAVAEIEQKRDKDWMIGELNYQEARLALLSLFLQLQRTPVEFINLVKAVIAWRNEEFERQKQYAAAQERTQQNPIRSAGRGGRRRERGGAAIPAWLTQPKTLPQGITDRTAADLLKLPGLNETSQSRIFSELRRTQQRLEREPDYRNNFHARITSLKAAVDAIRLQIFSREMTLPVLPAEHRYGLIFIDASSSREGHFKEVATPALAWLKALHAVRDAKIVPVLHRMGRRDVVYTWTDKRPSKFQLTQEDILPSSLPHFVPLLGPVLDHYPQEQVAFVAIVSINAVRDLYDWTEQAIWQTRINLLALSKNAEHPAAQRIELKTEAAATIDNLLNKANRMTTPTRSTTP